MKKVIGGKVYDTETATFLCQDDPGGIKYGHKGIHCFDPSAMALYRTPKGAFFYFDWDGIRLPTCKEAPAMFAETYMDADDYLEFFPAEEA